eukprot:SAG22_NODE_1002_length_6052_cov_3.257558_4_plen_250_part_00
MDDRVEKAIWASFTGRRLAAWQYVVQGRAAFEDALANGCWVCREGSWARQQGGRWLKPLLVDETNAEGWTALHVAANAGDCQALQILLDNGADVEARDGKGRTAVMKAAAEGHRNVLELLHGHRAQLRAVDRFGVNAAHLAARPFGGGAARGGGHDEALEWLVAHGVRPCCRGGRDGWCNVPGCTRNTPPARGRGTRRKGKGGGKRNGKGDGKGWRGGHGKGGKDGGGKAGGGKGGKGGGGKGGGGRGK